MVTSAEPQTYGGSKIIEALERTWSAVQANHPDLPDVVIITGSGQAGKEWGHTWGGRWAPAPIGATLEDRPEDPAPSRRMAELSIAGECLACGARFALETLLHEATHVLALARGIKDTSNQCRYHNARFLALAEELGLAWPAGTKPHPRIGYSAVVLRAETVTRYADQVADLAEQIRLYLPLPAYLRAAVGAPEVESDDSDPPPALPPTIPRPPRDGTASRSRFLLAQCQCDKPRKIRVARATFDAGSIDCGKCNQPFELDETQED